MARVRWTEAETQQVVSKAKELFYSGRRAWFQSLLSAMYELPKDRQQSIAALRNKSIRMRMAVETMHKEEISQQSKQPKEEVSVAEISLEKALSNFLDNILSRKLEDLHKAIQQDLRTIFCLSGSAQQPEIERDRKKKVLIVGMLGQQITQIQKDHGKQFYLTFHKTEESNHLLLARLEGVDTVLVNTGKINHSMYHIIQRKAKDLHQFAGGVSSVNRILGLLEVAQ